MPHGGVQDGEDIDEINVSFSLCIHSLSPSPYENLRRRVTEEGSVFLA